MGNVCSPCFEDTKEPPTSPLVVKTRDLNLADSEDDIDDFKTVMSKRTLESEIWHDALMEHDWMGEEIFDVSDEELEIIKAHLKSLFPNDAAYMSDAYIKSVASKPYSKNMSIRRPLDYSMDKLVHVLEWRKKNNMPDLEKWVELARANENDGTADWTTVKNLMSTLNTNSLYFHGLTKDGRPIMWVRTNRKHRWPNVDAEIYALGLIFDAAIRNGMPNGNTDFCIIAHQYNPPPPHPKCGFRMLKGLVEGYPDRMHVLIAAPVSRIVEMLMGVLLPLMPGRLAEKFVFLGMEQMGDRLEELLLNGRDDIPTFLGGTANHEEYYPEEWSCPSRGGILKFDYFGMVQRLQEQKDAFENRKRVSFALNGTSTNGMNGHGNLLNGVNGMNGHGNLNGFDAPVTAMGEGIMA